MNRGVAGLVSILVPVVLSSAGCPTTTRHNRPASVRTAQGPRLAFEVPEEQPGEAAEEESDSISSCPRLSTAETSFEFEPETARRRAMSQDEAERDLAALATRIQTLFSGLRSQTDVLDLLPRGTPRERMELADLVREYALCPTRVTSLRYRRSSARVALEFGPDAPFRTTFIESPRSGAGAWVFNAEQIFMELAERLLLVRARSFLRAQGSTQVFRRGSGLSHPTYLVDEGQTTLCVPDQQEARGGMSCFRGTGISRDSEASVVGDSEICLRSSSRDNAHRWVVDLTTGEIYNGFCAWGEVSRRAAPSVAIRQVEIPENLLELEGLHSLYRSGAVLVLASESHYQACIFSGDTLPCSQVNRIDSSRIAGVRFPMTYLGRARAQSNLDSPSDIEWFAVHRSRDQFGGSEVRAGDDALLVYHLEGDALLLQGAIPIGGYGSSRLYHDPEDQTVWETERLAFGRISIDERGCLSIRRPRRRRTRETRGGRHAGTTTRRLSRPDAAPETLDGRDLPDVYGALQVDTSGTWRVAPEGGFVRVRSCSD